MMWCLTIKVFDGKNRQAFEDWIDEINQACRASDRDFRTEVFKKSTGAVQWVVLSCDGLTDDKLIAKLRSCFSYAPMMNEAREELRSMRQLEHKSVSVYIYTVEKSTLQIIRNLPWKQKASPYHQGFHLIHWRKTSETKLPAEWAEMRQPPSTIEKAFKLACDVEKQLQVVDSFKLEFSSYPTVEVKEMSAEESSGDELNVNKVSRGKKWGSNNNYNQKHALILVIATTMATDPNRTNLRITDKVSSGDRNQKTPKSHWPRNQPTMCPLNSAAVSLNSLAWQWSLNRKNWGSRKETTLR